MKIFGREPAVWIAVISGVLDLAVSFGLPHLSTMQAGAIMAAISALGGVWTAVHVRPITPAAFTGLVTAAASLLLSYGVHVTQQQTGAATVLVLALLTLLTRQQVTPTADPHPIR